MARESNVRPNYEIIAYLTLAANRVGGGKALQIVAKDEEELKTTALDIAKAVKADVVQLKSGDVMIIRL